MADSRRLKQVLLNLISNAIKYNRPGGSITVRARPDGAEGVRLDVIDAGIGMTYEQLARLFQPFERLDAALRGIEGNGLGLAVSKALVEAMDGHDRRRVDARHRLGLQRAAARHRAAVPAAAPAPGAAHAVPIATRPRPPPRGITLLRRTARLTPPRTRSADGGYAAGRALVAGHRGSFRVACWRPGAAGRAITGSRASAPPGRRRGHARVHRRSVPLADRDRRARSRPSPPRTGTPARPLGGCPVRPQTWAASPAAT